MGLVPGSEVVCNEVGYEGDEVEARKSIGKEPVDDYTTEDATFGISDESLTVDEGKEKVYKAALGLKAATIDTIQSVAESTDQLNETLSKHVQRFDNIAENLDKALEAYSESAQIAAKLVNQADNITMMLRMLAERKKAGTLNLNITPKPPEDGNNEESS